MMHFVYVVTYLGKMVVLEREIRSLMITWLGQNGQIPSIFEIFCPRNTVSKKYSDLPLFVVLELGELEYHIF